MAIPKDTKIPQASQFAKLKDGRNIFRIMSDMVVGFEGWKDKKPFRHEGQDCLIKDDQVDLNQNGKPNINYFWAMAVWNYELNQIQVLQITQKTIMSTLYDYEENSNWGDLKGYDIEIHKKKEGEKTTYNVIAIPPKELSDDIKQAYKESKVDLSKLFEGKYPMDDAPDVDENGVPFKG